MKGGFSLKTPVVIIGFNRPDLLSSVLSNSNLVDRRVYISIDGPRHEEEVDEVRDCINLSSAFLEINPAGKLQFSPTNLGCKRGVTTAIDWGFSFEESLIILEDDIVPNDFFFNFMDEQLEKNKSNQKIWQINGHSALPQANEFNGVHLSIFPQIWGWGTWKDRWLKYNRDLKGWNGSPTKIAELNSVNYFTDELANYWKDRLNECAGGFDTWDYQWVYSMWLESAYSIAPGLSLSANQGFDDRATHTKLASDKNRDRAIDLNKRITTDVEPKYQSSLDELVAFTSYGILPGTNTSWGSASQKKIQRAISILVEKRALKLFLKSRLTKIVKSAQRNFWSAWNQLRIYQFLKRIKIWNFIVLIHRKLH
jgi:hypothetical protein